MFLGHKTLVFWETYEYENLLDPKLAPEQMLDALKGLGDHALLASLQMAAIPTPRIVIGNQRLAAWLPLLTDIALAGWEPIPAAQTDERLFVTRAGRGLGTYLCSGNETPDTISSQLDVESRYLGNGSFFLLRHDGKPTVTDVGGQYSRVPFKLEPREPAIWRAAGQLEPALEAKVTAQAEKTADHQRVTLQIIPKAAYRGTLRLPLPQDMKLASATLNGKPLATKAAGGAVEGSVSLPAGKAATVEAVFRSVVFQSSEEAILGLPWVLENRVNFKVEGAGKSVEAQYAVQRISGYFPYYLKNAVGVQEAIEVTPRPAFTVKVLVDPRQAAAQTVALARAGKVLTVSGKTPQDVKAAAHKLLAVLDGKFPYAGRLPATNFFREAGVAEKEVK